MGKKRAHEATKKNGNGQLEDWATALAARTTASETTTTTKTERIEKRLAKKRRREESKQERGKSNPIFEAPAEENDASSQKKPSARREHSAVASRASKQLHRLNLLSQKVEERVALIKQNSSKTWKKPYSPVPIVPKKRRRQREDCQQPRASDYGGIGLARASLWIPLDDPSWQPKLEEEFAEHVPGFFGKQRTKAMKKQVDGKMLWRQLVAEKQGQDLSSKQKLPGNQKINGKKLSAMSPDERVEAMIRAGMI